MIPDGALLFSNVYILPQKICPSFAFTYNLKYLFTVHLPQLEVLFIFLIQSTVQAIVILCCGGLVSVLPDGFTY